MQMLTQKDECAHAHSPPLAAPSAVARHLRDFVVEKQPCGKITFAEGRGDLGASQPAASGRKEKKSGNFCDKRIIISAVHQGHDCKTRMANVCPGRGAGGGKKENGGRAFCFVFSSLST
jgi:hypothetical protein